MPTRNYCFRADAPLTRLEDVDRQMLAAHRYRNRLCELELARRKAAEDTIRRLSPDYAALAEAYDMADAAVEAAYQDVKKDRAKARTRLEPTDAQKKAIATAKAARKQAATNLKSSRAAAYQRLKDLQAPYWLAADQKFPPASDSYKPRTRKQQVRAEALARLADDNLDAGQLTYEAARKQARAESGCYHGTYLIAEEAAKDFGKGPPPRFKRWDGNGTIGIQCQGGLSVEDAIAGKDTMLRIRLDNEEELAVAGESHGARSIGSVSIRIGSEERAPIWAEFPVRFHRPLPPHGSIRFAYLHRRRRVPGSEWLPGDRDDLQPALTRDIAQQDEWMLRLTVTDPETRPAAEDTSSRVAIHLGWRMMDTSGQLRTAVWFGSDGRQGDVLIDADAMDHDVTLKSIESERDLQFAEIHAHLTHWTADNPDLLPHWFQTEAAFLPQWRSAEKLGSLITWWRDHRFAGDEQIFPTCDSWRKWDKHRIQHANNVRSKIQGQRNQSYRTLLKRLSREYCWLVMAKIDWKKLSRKEASDDEVTQTASQRHNARLSSPGLMTEFAKEYFGGRILWVKPDFVTMTCNQCQHQHQSLDRSKRIQTCSHCGATWDQDQNAARNEMALATVPADIPEPIEIAYATDDAD